MAHSHPLAALALNSDGKRLATASDKGTLVRIWNTGDCTPLQARRLCAWLHGPCQTQARQQKCTIAACVCLLLPLGLMLPPG